MSSQSSKIFAVGGGSGWGNVHKIQNAEMNRNGFAESKLFTAEDGLGEGESGYVNNGG